MSVHRSLKLILTLYPSTRSFNHSSSPDSHSSTVHSNHCQSSEMVRKGLLINETIFTPSNENKKMYSNTPSSFEKPIEKEKKALPVDHPDMTLSKENIARNYFTKGEYPQALSFYKQLLEVEQKSSPFNHSDLSMCHYNIAQVYFQMKDYEKALLAYTRSAQTIEESLSANDKHLAKCYESISLVYYRLGDYFQARQFSKQSIDISTKRVSDNHAD